MSFIYKIELLQQEMFTYIDNLEHRVYNLEDSEIYVILNGTPRDVYWLDFQDKIGWIIGFEEGQWLRLDEIDIYETAEIVDYLKSKEIEE